MARPAGHTGDRNTRRTRKPYRGQTSSPGTLFSWNVQRRHGQLRRSSSYLSLSLSRVFLSKKYVHFWIYIPSCTKIKHLLECVNKWSIDRYLREDNLLPVWVGANFRIPRLETYSFSFCANKKKKERKMEGFQRRAEFETNETRGITIRIARVCRANSIASIARRV